MEMLFMVVGGVGLVLLILSSVFSGILDFLDVGLDAVGGYSSAAIGVALTVFGAAGVLAHGAVAAPWLALVIALVSAFGLASVAQWAINKVAAKDLGRVDHNLVGTVGTVTSTIRNGLGEVRLDDLRENETRLARADVPMAVGTRVVVRTHDGIRVSVIPLEPDAVTPGAVPAEPDVSKVHQLNPDAVKPDVPASAPGPSASAPALTASVPELTASAPVPSIPGLTAPMTADATDATSTAASPEPQPSSLPAPQAPKEGNLSV
ncbi:MAG: hypothetical protein LBH13_09485 [Cellulomonadaceae bacterium]|jgi:membrane protein implicated in regulation of membrane protease activity|nr:hypothetical protein [Cellulomonadaceae bacterium]